MTAQAVAHNLRVYADWCTAHFEDVPPGSAQGLKERIAMDLEKYGRVRVTSVEQEAPAYQQMAFGDALTQQRGKR